MNVPARCRVSYHPDHEVGEEGYPECGGQEGEQIPALPLRQAAVGDGAAEQNVDGPRQEPLHSSTPTL